jgi:hypothetical protein
VNSAPLPKHERTWRHPSEIGPTNLEVDRGAGPRASILAGGAAAVVLVAVLVVSMTPRGDSAGPIAVSATTTPIVQSLRTSAGTAVSMRSPRLSTFSPIPAAIADVPAAAFEPTVAAEAARAILPDLDDEVLVLTDTFAYSVAWRDAARLDVEEGIVVGRDGEVVARFIEGRLVASHDLLVGAALSLD